MSVSLSKLSSFSFVYFKTMPPPGILMVLLYQKSLDPANHTFPGFRHNAGASGGGYGFCMPPFLLAPKNEEDAAASRQILWEACMRSRNTAALHCGWTAWKFLCFAQSHPIYSGGLTVLTDLFGVIVSPSISQRNCCCVSERTSSGLRGHWNLLSDNLLYNRSQPSPSHTSPLMRSARLPQKR